VEEECRIGSQSVGLGGSRGCGQRASPLPLGTGLIAPDFEDSQTITFSSSVFA
jgi:hypothetical protein